MTDLINSANAPKTMMANQVATNYPGAVRLEMARKRYIGHYMRPTIESMEEYYALMVVIQSDTSEHLPTLRRLAGECDSVGELGTWHGNSTVAMMMGRPKKMFAVDIAPCRWRDRLEMVAEFYDVDLTIHNGDSRTVDLPEVDLLFVDSEHSYEQVHAELTQHIDKVRKYLVFHDTVTYSEIQQAIHEVADKDFTLVETYINNNGLWVMERK